MNMHQISGTLPAVPPFDFNQSLRFLGHFRPAMGEQAISDELLVKAVMVRGKAVVFSLKAAGTKDAPALDYTLYSEAKLSVEEQAEATDRIAFFLSLNDDLRPFYALAADDPALAPVVQALYGYHQVKFLTPFENVCWALLSQRNLMAVARGMKERLAEVYGGVLSVNGTTYRAFPEAERLALATVDEINQVVQNARKSECIASAAHAFDGIDESWLRDAPYDDVERWMKQIKGVGDWSASFVLLRGLGRMEQVPVGEKWLLMAASRRYGRTLTQEDLDKLGAPYGEYSGYWAHYLRVAE
jgi:DNA-3-methyladenine glycosylase II